MSIPVWFLPETKYKYSFADVTGTPVEPKRGIKKSGPYSRDKFRGVRIGVAMLCPAVHRQIGERFYQAFQHGLRAYRPFHEVYHLTCDYRPVKVFSSGTDADAYRAAAVELAREVKQTPADLWLCFLLIEDRFKQTLIRANPYFVGRAILLSNQILVQSVTIEKARRAEGELQWILDSIAVQSYAKLGGAPWTVAVEHPEPEIIIGIGEARMSGISGGERVFGFATVFNQNGAYLWTGFGQPVTGFDNYVVSLRDRVKLSTDEYMRIEKVAPKRLIIHLYKPPGKRTEARAIETALAELGSGIECAIVHVDHNTDFRAFDLQETDLKPRGGLVMFVDDYQRLVVLSGSEVSWIPPRIARLQLSPRSTYRNLNALTEQVYHFTKVNWAGFQPNNVPVTIKYPAQLAQKYASLEQLEGDWYGLITDAFLAQKPWFI